MATTAETRRNPANVLNRQRQPVPLKSISNADPRLPEAKWARILPKHPKKRQAALQVLQGIQADPEKVIQTFRVGWTGKYRDKEKREYVDRAVALLDSMAGCARSDLEEKAKLQQILAPSATTTTTTTATTLAPPPPPTPEIVQYRSRLADLRKACRNVRSLQQKAKKEQEEANGILQRLEGVRTAIDDAKTLMDSLTQQKKAREATARKYQHQASKFDAIQREWRNQLNAQTLWLFQTYAGIQFPTVSPVCQPPSQEQEQQGDDDDEQDGLWGGLQGLPQLHQKQRQHNLLASRFATLEALQNGLHLSGSFVGSPALRQETLRKIRRSEPLAGNKTPETTLAHRRQIGGGKEPRREFTSRNPKIRLWYRLSTLLQNYDYDDNTDVPEILLQREDEVYPYQTPAAEHVEAEQGPTHPQPSWYERATRFWSQQGAKAHDKRDYNGAKELLMEHDALLDMSREDVMSCDDQELVADPPIAVGSDERGGTSKKQENQNQKHPKDTFDQVSNDASEVVALEVRESLLLENIRRFLQTQVFPPAIEESIQSVRKLFCTPGLPITTADLSRVIMILESWRDQEMQKGNGGDGESRAPHEPKKPRRKKKQVKKRPQSDQIKTVSPASDAALPSRSSPPPVPVPPVDPPKVKLSSPASQGTVVVPEISRKLLDSVGNPCRPMAYSPDLIRALLEDSVASGWITSDDQQVYLRLMKWQHRQIRASSSSSGSSGDESHPNALAQPTVPAPDPFEIKRKNWAPWPYGFLKVFLTNKENLLYLQTHGFDARISMDLDIGQFRPLEQRKRQYQQHAKIAHAMSQLAAPGRPSIMEVPMFEAKLWSNSIHIDSWVPDFRLCTREQAIAAGNKRGDIYNLAPPWDYTMGGWVCVRCVQYLATKHGDCACRCFRGHTRSQCLQTGSGCFGFHPCRYMEYLALGLPYHRESFDSELRKRLAKEGFDWGTLPTRTEETTQSTKTGKRKKTGSLLTSLRRQNGDSASPFCARVWDAQKRWRVFRDCVKEIILGEAPTFGIVSNENAATDGLVTDFAPLLQDWFFRAEYSTDARGPDGRCSFLVKAHLDIMLDPHKYDLLTMEQRSECSDKTPSWKWISNRCPFCGLPSDVISHEVCRGSCSGCRSWAMIKSRQTKLIRERGSVYHLRFFGKAARQQPFRRSKKRTRRSRQRKHQAQQHPQDQVDHGPKPAKKQKTTATPNPKEKEKQSTSSAQPLAESPPCGHINMFQGLAQIPF